jgi:hypothetical protein
MGFFKTVVLVPRMEKTPPIGMFKRGSTVRVWIETDDDRRLPVRFEVGFKFGHRHREPDRLSAAKIALL